MAATSDSGMKNIDEAQSFIDRVFADLNLSAMEIGFKKKPRRNTRNVRCILSFRKRMFALYLGLQLFHEKAMSDFLYSLPIGRQNIFCLISCHCFDICDRCPNIILAFVYSCVFIYLVAEFCKQNCSPEFQLFAPMCAIELFEHRVREDLESLGGFEKLRDYMDNNENVVEMVTFIKRFHLERQFRSTTVTIPNYVVKYDTQNMECYYEFLNRLPVLTDFLLDSFACDVDYGELYVIKIFYALTILELEISKFIRDFEMVDELCDEVMEALTENILQDFVEEQITIYQQPPPPYHTQRTL